MFKYIASGLFVVLLAACGVYLVGKDAITTKMLEHDCKEHMADAACLDRARAFAHDLSEDGKLDKAEKWYELAATHHDAVAMFHLGWLYQRRAELAEQGGGHPIETRKTVYHYKKAAEKWYLKSAKEGFAPAMNNLGELYISGIGMQEFKEKGFRWHLAAARGGNPAAYLNVMLDYAAGVGVKQDKGMAEKWSVWKPDKLDRRDILTPTLERSFVARKPIPEEKIEKIRNIGVHGGVLETVYKSTAPTPPPTQSKGRRKPPPQRHY